jgi:uncharacterized protein (DUF58 family)
MNLSILVKKPIHRLPLGIRKVIISIYTGAHNSLISGKGLNFKGFRPYKSSDNPLHIDDSVSERISSMPDLEPWVRTYYTERTVNVTCVLDTRPSMTAPLRKQEYAAELVWLFALSAFEYNDPFRLIVFHPNASYDSGWMSSEDQFTTFLHALSSNRIHPTILRKNQDMFSFLVTLQLHDTLMVGISDFTANWGKEIDSLRFLNMSKKNIRVVLCGLDEWKGFSPQSYGAVFMEPGSQISHQDDLRKGRNTDRRRQEAEDRFRAIAQRAHSRSVTFIPIPLLEEPITEVRRTFLRRL